MRVENPRFDEETGLECEDCPWADKNGWGWREEGCGFEGCPRNMEEYTAACLMAEEAKGGKGMIDKEWVAQLKIGDLVAVWDRYHKIYSGVVKRLTPTGRIVLDGGTVFRPDGWVHKAAGSCYSDRHLRKP